jgi:hypothetical protein
MAIVFDLNAQPSRAELSAWDAPLDSVMVIAALARRRAPNQDSAPIVEPLPRQPAPEADDLTHATWKDAEWQ